MTDTDSPPPSAPDQLLATWSAWVRQHLGAGDPKRVERAATAGRDAVVAGKGINAAYEAARAAWGGSHDPGQAVTALFSSRRLGLWSALVSLTLGIAVEIAWMTTPINGCVVTPEVQTGVYIAPALVLVGGVLTLAAMRAFNRAGCLALIGVAFVMAGVSAVLFLLNGAALFGASFCGKAL